MDAVGTHFSEHTGSSRQAAASLGSDAGESGHAVQFYSDDAFLLEELSRSMGAAIGAGDASVVIATRAHGDELAKKLMGRGLDLALAARQGRYVLLDAGETLATFMVDGWPDAERFAEVVGKVIHRAGKAVQGEHSRVVAFGEMVALLWAKGQTEAAIRLEQLWNELAKSHDFYLHCAYPMHLFSGADDGSSMGKICREHSSVLPAESYTSLMTDEDRLRSIVFLQQKAQALEAEVLARKTAQQELHEREAELRDFLENALIGMHWVDADGIILWANQAEMDLLGFERHEYIGHHISEFYADNNVIEDILQRLGRNEELHDYEARMKARDGSVRHVRIDSNALMRDGKFIHTRCFTIDITERKHAEEARMRLAAIVNTSEDAIFSKDLNGVVTSWNAGAERIFGYKPDEIIGQPITILFPEELQNDEPAILEKIRRGERIEHFQTVRQTKAGVRIDVSLTVSPVKDQHGKVIGAAKIVRDITQQRQLERALRTSEQLASVGRLAATIAHEINNPLESVTNFIYLAKTSPDLSDDLQRYLNCADQELTRVAHIARQTLGFYRDSSRPAWLSVAKSVDDVARVYERKFEYKGLTVEKKIDPRLKLYTLEGEFKQVLSNLLSNAIDASREGGKVWIRARETGLKSGKRGVCLVIADNGSGIPAQHRNSLFAPFFTTKKEVGTGLGLWITKELIDKAGGQIRFRSRVGSSAGTVMMVLVPLMSETGPVKAG